MPRARRKPSTPRPLKSDADAFRGDQRLDRLDGLGRLEDELLRLERQRGEMIDRGASEQDISRLDSRIRRLRLKRGDQASVKGRNRDYVRALARVRRRGRTRDYLAALARSVDDLTPELLMAADVYRRARGVDLGFPGLSAEELRAFVNLTPEELRAIGERESLFPGISVAGSDGLNRWTKGRAASDAKGKPVKASSLPPTFKPKARNKRVVRASDGGMAAMADRMWEARLVSGKVVAAFDDALCAAGYDDRIGKAAARVILNELGLNAAAVSLTGKRLRVQRQILSAVITGLSGVSSHLGLRFGG